MVIKTCIICGKEFNARGRDKCCSIECTKIKNRIYMKKYRQSDKYKEYYENNRDKILEQHKEYRQSDKYKENRKKYDKKYWQSDKGKATRRRYKQSDKGKAADKRYRESDRGQKYRKEYRQSDKGKAIQKRYIQNKVAELNNKFDGDLELILNECPVRWMVREAIMQVEYGVSYAEAMYQKMKTNPVCEITGKSNNLVIHHLNSFNTHPELGADPNNMVRITDDIHNEFHKIYNYGNNTREQWNEFVKNLNKKKRR